MHAFHIDFEPTFAPPSPSRAPSLWTGRSLHRLLLLLLRRDLVERARHVGAAMGACLAAGQFYALL